MRHDPQSYRLPVGYHDLGVKVCLWTKLGSEAGAGFTDLLLTGQKKFIRAKHVNELRQVLEWLRYGRWEMPWYMAAGMHEWFPDTP